MTIFSAKKLGIAAALTVGLVSSAAAQATSTQRIPVRKESTGDVAPTPPRVDAVTVTRVDTVFRYRTDTVTVTGPTRTMYDTTRIETLPAYLIRRGGMYFGLAAGGAYPHGSLEVGNTAGLAGQVQLGWQSLNSPIGIRADVNYAQYGENPTFANLGGDPDVINGNLDLKLGIPLLGDRIPRMSLYAIGGGSYTYYKNLRIEVTDPPGDAPGQVVSSGDWSDKWGGNVGAGLQFGFGRANLFLEGRFQTMNIGNTTQNHVPIVLGLIF